MSKISELSDGGALQSTDYLIAVRSGGNVKVRPNGAVSGTTGQFSTSLNVDGTVTADGLTVNSGTTNEVARFESTDGTAYLSIMDNNTSNSLQGIGSAGNDLTFYANAAERMRIDSAGGAVFTPAAGGHAVFNEGSVDSDFRVESDGLTHALFVDAGADKVFVGSTLDLGAARMSVAAPSGYFNGFAVGSGQNNSVTLGNFVSGDEIANLITSSSKFGGVIQGGANGNLVLGVRDNDVTDGLFVVTGTGTGGGQVANGYSRLRLSITPTDFVINETSDDTDFRVESDSNNNMLFVDAGNNRVGVGTGNPAYTFVVSNGGAEGLEISAGGVSANRQNIISYNRSTSAYNSLWLDASEIVLQPPGGGGGSVLVGSSTNHVSGKLFVDGKIKTNYSNEISMQYNVSGSTAGYHKGMAGTSPETTAARGLHIFNYDNDGDEGIKFYSGAPSGTAYQKVNFKAGQTGEIVFNDNSYDQDFRVESDSNTHALFVDASENRVFAGGLSSGSVGTAQFIVNAGQIGGSVNDTLRLQQWYYGTGNGSFFGHKARRFSANGVWTGVDVSTVLEVDNSADIYKYITYGIPNITINEDGNDMDFRVESANYTHAFFVQGSNGRVNIGDATVPAAALYISTDANLTEPLGINDSGANGATLKHRISIKYQTAEVGSIKANNSITTFNTSSDARLKENIADADDAGELIDAIQVRQFNWIVDGAHQRYGMVAQELITVAPEAVSEGETEEEMMGVDYSKLVPMLIKEIQSLRARVAQLEGA